MKLLIPLAFAITLLGAELPAVAQKASSQEPARSAQTLSRSYIGRIYSNFPKELKYLGGWVIDGDPRNPQNSKYAAVFARHSKAPNTVLLWLETLSKDAKQGVGMQILDVLEIPEQHKSRTIAFGFCQLNRKNDRGIVAIVEPTNTQFRTRIYQAWYINIKTEKIEPISSKGIACDNPDWGVRRGTPIKLKK